MHTPRRSIFPCRLTEGVLARYRLPSPIPDYRGATIVPFIHSSFDKSIAGFILVRLRVWQVGGQGRGNRAWNVGHFEMFNSSNVVINPVSVGELNFVGCFTA